jgi:hypothetical protein
VQGSNLRRLSRRFYRPLPRSTCSPGKRPSSTTPQLWPGPKPPARIGNFAYDTAEAIIEAPAYDNGKRFYDLAPFGSVKFYDLGIGGVYALRMVRGNTTLASTSLPSVAGRFRDRYRESCGYA